MPIRLSCWFLSAHSRRAVAGALVGLYPCTVASLALLASTSAGAQGRQSPAPRAPSAQAWVTRAVDAPRVSQRRFTSAAARTEVSFHLYTPAAYDREPTRRFPVVYWLHGSGGGLAGIPQVARRFDAAIAAGKMPPVLVVFVHGLEMGMYVDWYDGSAPVETVLAKELVAHMDATYRTVASREGRLLDGFSMGGYGAARFGFKYADAFRAVSIMGAGPMQEALAVTPRASPMQAAELLQRVYGGEQARFRAVSPRRLAEEHAATLAAGSLIRVVVGDRDETFENNRAFHAHLERLGIPHEWRVLPGVPHNPNAVLDALGDDHWAFYRRAFASPSAPPAAPPAAPASTPSAGRTTTAAKSDSVITLTFLGTGAPRPSRDRHGPAILVEAGDKKLLIDAGPGVRQRLFEAGGFALITGVTDIFATHLHYDHVGGVADVWIPGWMYGRTRALRVFGPPGTKEFVGGLTQAYRWDVTYRQIVGIAAPGSALESHEVTPGVVYDEGGVRVTAFSVAHMPIDPATGRPGALDGDTYGFRVDYAGRSVAFSGDLRVGPSSPLVAAGRGADVVVMEVQVPSPGNSAEAQRANVSLSVHTSPEEAGRAFAAMRPRLAVYSHIIPPQTTADELREATRPFYDGPLVTAFDLMRLTIGRHIEVSMAPRRDGEVFEQSGAVRR